MKKELPVLVGTITLVVGLALILVWWPNVVALLKGAIGVILALAGLLVLHSAKTSR